MLKDAQLEWFENSLKTDQPNKVVIAGGKGSISSADISCYVLTYKTLEELFKLDDTFKTNVENCECALIKPNLTQTPSFFEDCEKINRPFSNGVNASVFACQAIVDFLLENDASNCYIGESVVWTPDTHDTFDKCGYTEVFLDYGDMVDLIDLRTTEEDVEVGMYGAINEIDKPEAQLTISLEGEYATTAKNTVMESIKNTKFESKLEKLIDNNLSFPLNRTIEDIDLFISVAKLKTHTQMLFSGAIKNRFGLLEPPSRRHAAHLKIDPLWRNQTRYELAMSFEYLTTLICNLDRALTSFFETRKIGQLDIIEGGFWALEGDGPLWHGYERRENVVLAAYNNPLAIDTVAAELMFTDIAPSDTYQERFKHHASAFFERKNLPKDSMSLKALEGDLFDFYPISYAQKQQVGESNLSKIGIWMYDLDRVPQYPEDMRQGGLFQSTIPFKSMASLTHKAYNVLFEEFPDLRDEKIVVVEKKAKPKHSC
ncbi:MAG: DUF362 domain-containing protein [Promethearchaeota archaeon]